MSAEWRLLQGKRTVHLCEIVPHRFLLKFRPVCGASDGFPFVHSQYSGNLNPFEFGKCKKCLAVEEALRSGEAEGRMG